MFPGFWFQVQSVFLSLAPFNILGLVSGSGCFYHRFLVQGQSVSLSLISGSKCGFSSDFGAKGCVFHWLYFHGQGVFLCLALLPHT